MLDEYLELGTHADSLAPLGAGSYSGTAKTNFDRDPIHQDFSQNHMSDER